MQWMRIVISLMVLIALHFFTLGKATEAWKTLPKEESASYVLPSFILKVTALEYDGLASDYLFLESLVFFGSTFERHEKPRVKEWEWKWLYNVLDASATLDPYFLDPYYLGNAILTWDGGLIRETNTLLEKGSRYRDWDSLLPFYIGFNYFYFLQENEKASDYLMEASRRGGASPVYADLAVKLAYKGKRTGNAIAFQEHILKQTEDPRLRKEYEDRIAALRGILVLENATALYRQKFGRYPVKLEELIKKRIIAELPKEPYGGKYYIDSQGTVKTTSESWLMPYKH